MISCVQDVGSCTVRTHKMEDDSLYYSFEEKILAKYNRFVQRHGMRNIAALVIFFPLNIYRLGRSVARNSKRILALTFSVMVFALSLSFTDAGAAEEPGDAVVMAETESFSSGDSGFLMELEEEREAVADETGAADDSPVFSADDWKLILVNKQHPIPRDYEVPLGKLNGWQQCDERISEYVRKMLEDGAKEGMSLSVVSPYRESDRQEKLFNRKITAYMAKGMSYVDAYKKASQAVTVPGSSEHEIGLAFDIVSRDHRALDFAFGDTPEGKWLSENCWKYGFIIRYPKGKEHITSIEYEPWHFRYVGEEAARVMYEENLTLEEFWDKYL